MEDSKRLILAVLLSAAVWLVWVNFVQKPKPQPVMDTTVSEQSKADKKAEKKEVKTENIRKETLSSIAVSKTAQQKESDIKIKTDRYTVNLSSRGAAITEFKYSERNVELVVSTNRFEAKGVFDFPVHLSEDEFLNGNALENAVWNYSMVSSNAVRFEAVMSINGAPLRIEKTYAFADGNNYFTVEYNLVNTGGKEVRFPNEYIIFSPSDFLGPDMDFTNTYNNLASIYYLNGEFERSDKGGGFFSKEGELTVEKGTVKWAGIMSRYFLLLMIPDKAGTGMICDHRKDTGFRTGIYMQAEGIKPGQRLSKSFKIYTGEKNKDKLAAVDPDTKDAADVSSWIEPIRDFVLWSLLKINLLFGNLGWSLVVFSILSKVVLLPLTQKSTESMKKMQALAPKITELKAKYKDKPELLNKEMMKLYKTNKVNPMGGCLPLLLQMPFFFALYSALINSVDLWQAPFVLWIKDLSLPDTVFAISGFNINILPIIMTATSFLQQKMSNAGGSVGQQQKMMMLMMPLVFIFIFWNMPSGLVLYWTMQNLLQILHQLYIDRKGEVKET